ncbi:MAG: nuclear transport factor 2 family protein [Candidatus Rokubacteria bacterium]|nr:nuclear transport factor 2 family protein [Candidatus Rokubacteria bacterium]
MTAVEAVNEAALARVAEGFRTKDIDAILDEFAEDGVFELAAGPEPCGERFQGKAAIRTALERMFKGPSFSLETATRWIAGDRAVSEWTYVATGKSGRRIEVRGCDLFALRDGKVTRKDTYLKQVVAPKT